MKEYHDLLKRILATGEGHDDRTGVGTISRFGEQMRFCLRDGFPLLTTKRVPFRWVAEELLWFLSGSTDESLLLAKGVDIWREWATKEQCARFGREEGDLGPVYGYLWRSFGGHYPERDGVDQIARLLRDLMKQPNSRRLIVSGWDARTCDDVALPPCHTLFQFKVHADDSLSCHLYARSIDSFLGLSFNIASYALLTRLIAHVTCREPRELIISFGDVYIYKNHLSQVEELLSRAPRESPRLKISSLVDEGITPLEQLLSIRYESLQLTGYNPHPKIEAPVAI